jgi:hypothetical protein
MACGAVVVCDHFPALEAAVGDRIVYARARGDTERLLRALLREPALRARIGARARAFVVDGHTWAHRMVDALAFVGRLAGDRAAGAARRNRPLVLVLVSGATMRGDPRGQFVVDALRGARDVRKKLVVVTEGAEENGACYCAPAIVVHNNTAAWLAALSILDPRHTLHRLWHRFAGVVAMDATGVAVARGWFARQHAAPAAAGGDGGGGESSFATGDVNFAPRIIMVIANASTCGATAACGNDCFVDAIVRVVAPPLPHGDGDVVRADGDSAAAAAGCDGEVVGRGTCDGAAPACHVLEGAVALGDRVAFARMVTRVLSAPRAEIVARISEPAPNAVIRVAADSPAHLTVARPPDDAFRALRDGCWCVLLNGAGAGCTCDPSTSMVVTLAAEAAATERALDVQVALRGHMTSHVFAVSPAHRVRVVWEPSAAAPAAAAVAPTGEAAAATAGPALCAASSAAPCRIDLGCLAAPQPGWTAYHVQGCGAIVRGGGGTAAAAVVKREARFAWDAALAALEVAEEGVVEERADAVPRARAPTPEQLVATTTPEAAGLLGPHTAARSLVATVSRLGTASVDALVMTSALTTVPGVLQRQVLGEMRRCVRAHGVCRACQSPLRVRSALRPGGTLSLIEFDCHVSLEALLALDR